MINTKHCAICAKDKPSEVFRKISKYNVCDECYNTPIEDLPRDVEIKIPDGVEWFDFAAYFPLSGEVHMLQDFTTRHGEDMYTQVISHEIFHVVLLRNIGWEACLMWDNVSGQGQIENEILSCG